MISNKLKRNIVILSVALLVSVTVATFFINYSADRSNYTAIDNFDDFYYNVPPKTKQLIFSKLNNTIKKNLSENAPIDGAIIRDTEPYLYSNNLNYDGYSGGFVVDIPSIQQSYFVDFSFSEDPDEIIEYGGVLIYCISRERMIYPDFNCKDNLPFVNGGAK